ncbi:MAG: hypothetical protein GAK30_00180 [Paracidovorax wautersii]|uniref:Uncharacterized protein n=1 Tax=Paracidovorax wautersii TaxID=1177982 RepID=A0A7V8JS33_9BURK|nr:MAG: hypothetical protein GAK30_00180 [Paracidovorax wautersii]
MAGRGHLRDAHHAGRLRRAGDGFHGIGGGLAVAAQWRSTGRAVQCRADRHGRGVAVAGAVGRPHRKAGRHPAVPGHRGGRHAGVSVRWRSSAARLAACNHRCRHRRHAGERRGDHRRILVAEMAQHLRRLAGHGLSDRGHAGRAHGRMAAGAARLAFGVRVWRCGNGIDDPPGAVALAGVRRLPARAPAGGGAAAHQSPHAPDGPRAAGRATASPGGPRRHAAMRSRPCSPRAWPGPR